MDPITLIRALETAGFEPMSYSGRGMYGRQCVGVSAESPFEVGVALGLALGEEARDLRVASDTLGRDTVLYFPGVAWPGNRDA